MPIVNRPAQRRTVTTNPRVGAFGMGAWDFDPLTGEWVESSPVEYSGHVITLPPTSITVTDTADPVEPVYAVLPPAGPLVDPHAGDGLPGNAPCNPNGLYPTGHRCAVLQQIKDAAAALAIAKGAVTGGGKTTAPCSARPTLESQLQCYGSDVTGWISRNTFLFAAGLLVTLVMASSRGGRR